MNQSEKDKWRFINAIMYTSVDLKEDLGFDKEYNPWFVGRSLSYHKDTIAYADIVNRLPLTKLQHFEYLLYAVPKRKRFAKFYYPEKDHWIVNVMEYFQCNEKKAKDYCNILNSEQLIQIANYKGGLKNE